MKRGRRRSAPREPLRTEEVEIASIGAGGEGVGRMKDGRVVFVHRTAPGERVETALFMERPRWARGRLLRVLRPSPERREAPCPHYEECGGCTVEHLHYPAQLEVKSRIVAEALHRIGGIAVDPPTVVPSPQEFRYRNRVSFALRRGGSGRVRAGFHALSDPGRIVQIDGACLLPEEPIARVWDRLRSVWGPDAKLLPSGQQLRLTLRATRAGAVSLLIEGGYSSGDPERLLEQVPGLESIWHRPESRAASHVAGAPGLPEYWGEESLEIRGSAFLQVNRSAAELLEDHVVASAAPRPGMRIVDAYCGVGLHARRLAALGAEVVGIELNPEAVELASAAGSSQCTFLEGRVEELLGSTLPADLLLLNPPRSGVDPAALEPLLERPPERIIYISCDPATLARDLKVLAPRFELEALRCFDLFPQTAHVESVVTLVRTPGEGNVPRKLHTSLPEQPGEEEG